jgi:predicted DNA-binding transcriptional regulator YafY
MYSPTTRLLTVLELLQSYAMMNGAELARRLEVDVRTVRRYITTLQDMGIPVEAERGPYGAYRLERGRRLPPLLYSDAEAIAITLGLVAIREFHFPVEVAAVEGALAKTERVLPENVLQQARSLQEAITFNTTPPPPRLRQDALVILSTAVQQRRQVHLHYQAWGSQESERDFDPYGILFNEGYWYTVGYCHLRAGLRTFRLDRIRQLVLLDAPFECPADFNLMEHVLASIAFGPTAYQVKILLKTTLEEAQASIPPIMGVLVATDEGVILQRTASDLDWLAHGLLWLEYPVVILEPPELRESLQHLATKAARLAQSL